MIRIMVNLHKHLYTSHVFVLLSQSSLWPSWSQKWRIGISASKIKVECPLRHVPMPKKLPDVCGWLLLICRVAGTVTSGEIKRCWQWCTMLSRCQSPNNLPSDAWLQSFISLFMAIKQKFIKKKSCQLENEFGLSTMTSSKQNQWRSKILLMVMGYRYNFYNFRICQIKVDKNWWKITTKLKLENSFILKHKIHVKKKNNMQIVGYII